MLESARSHHSARGGIPIRVVRLKLTNFRNYASLDLRLRPGTTLIEGQNGSGKTNLLESIYMLSIGRSARTTTDRDMVRTEAFDAPPVHAQVIGQVAGRAGDIRLQIDLSGASADLPARAHTSDGPRGGVRRVQKSFRVNGLQRRSGAFVGVLKAVLFTAEDIRLTSGPPSDRRRFMDILVSQLDQRYLSDIQEYQRIVTQRNHLLKSLRQGKSKEGELEFWDIRQAVHAARIMDSRSRAIEALSDAARPIHEQLSGSDGRLVLTYRPSVDFDEYQDVRDLSRGILETVQSQRASEIMAGHSLAGPHRDDIAASIDDMEVGTHSSRGQSRTVVLAIKLAEAEMLSNLSGDQPVILLDDVMSELDPTRRQQALDRISTYEQALVTTAEPTLAEMFGERDMNRITIDSGLAVPIA